MHARNIDIRRGKERVEFLDSGSGPTVVFLPSIWGAQPDRFLETLTREHRVVAPSLPGIGGSTGDDQINDVHDLLYHLTDFFDTLDIDDAALVGHGLGGMIAAEVAAMQPQRWRRLVLMAPFGLWDDQYPNEDILSYRNMDAQLQARAFHDQQHAAAAAMLEMPSDPDANVQAMVQRARHFQVAAKYLWPIPDRGLKKRIHRITTPTLILWGRHDRVVPPQYASDFQRLIPGSSVRFFERSAHFPQIEECEEATAVVAHFLKS